MRPIVLTHILHILYIVRRDIYIWSRIYGLYWFLEHCLLYTYCLITCWIWNIVIYMYCLNWVGQSYIISYSTPWCHRRSTTWQYYKWTNEITDVTKERLFYYYCCCWFDLLDIPEANDCVSEQIITSNIIYCYNNC